MARVRVSSGDGACASAVAAALANNNKRAGRAIDCIPDHSKLTELGIPILESTDASTIGVLVGGLLHASCPEVRCGRLWATAGGTIAAIAAAEQGMLVALLEQGRHVGGMLSGGLGRTDMDRQENVIGGFAREFFERAGKHYGEAVSWRFEPSVAERILNDWLKQTGIEVMFNHRLASVTKRAGRIVRLRTTSGEEI